MRERERLDDFQGGAVACRGCKRLLVFDSGDMQPQRCCIYAYVPSQRQVDLVIYDKLAPGEYCEIPSVEPREPLVIAACAYEETMGDSDEVSGPDPYLVDETEISNEEVDILAVTAEQVEERKAERLADLRRRGR